MQKDKAEKFYLTKQKLQMRKTAKITDYFPGNRDCMRKKQSPPQKDGGDFEKEKYKKDFLLLKPISQINRCVFPFGPASAPEHHFQYDRPKAVRQNMTFSVPDPIPRQRVVSVFFRKWFPAG